MTINKFFCKKTCSKHGHICTLPKNHTGACSYTAVSRMIEKIDKKAGDKLRCDSYVTPGNNGAAKNRADRCFPVQYSKKQIYEANKRGEVGVCIPKRFSSTPEDCFQINIDLATQVIAIKDLSFDKDDFEGQQRKILDYLILQAHARFPDSLRCRICNEPILIENFYTGHATSGAKSVQLGHIVPHVNGKDGTAHIASNTQWIHRDCNIIQGDKTEEETFDEIARILINQGYNVSKTEVKCA